MTDLHTGTTHASMDSLASLNTVDTKSDHENEKHTHAKKSILRSDSRFFKESQKKDNLDDSITMESHHYTPVHPNAHVSFKEDGVEIKEIKPNKKRRRYYSEDMEEADGWDCCNIF